ncbi:MAG: DMT family transporter [Eubacteriales bacterium]|nr:DMT family transporter [Eubacteriales bacterium]
MQRNRIFGSFLLLLAAVIWGAGFVAQRAGMEYIGPLTFGACRFWLAFIALYPVVLLTNKMEQKALSKAGEDAVQKTAEDILKSKKIFFLAATLCGTILFCGSIFQQYGMVFTTAGKAAFITALYILLVPLFSLVLKHRPGIASLVGVGFGTIGLYFLCITESFTIAKGDFIVLIGAFFWAAHVLIIDRFLPHVNPAKLAMAQFGICALYSTIGMFIFESPTWETIVPCLVPIVYAGVFSAGVGFTLQIFGQRHTTPTVASLLLSMEAVFGAVFGFFLLHETMSNRELAGCALMFSALIISQLPDKLFQKKEARKI